MYRSKVQQPTYNYYDFTPLAINNLRKGWRFYLHLLAQMYRVHVLFSFHSPIWFGMVCLTYTLTYTFVTVIFIYFFSFYLLIHSFRTLATLFTFLHVNTVIIYNHTIPGHPDREQVLFWVWFLLWFLSSCRRRCLRGISSPQAPLACSLGI